ncbi:SDR family NAD(P)-dependent oxidoreductase [Legionella impletisoli]|uniref:Short-chain dehydrogenase n=1 Tax=Legionella impletisoli TaxID=343510 RepID=A0A917JU34_9GAMM|nr:SDR family NAD(P)-dependent oxidoreductase [Legionella impletisoli]GGI81265.1 short-chain dehydrogenase [Legionella impletisoli]
MSKHWENAPVAVITGAGSGIGLALVNACLNKQMRVVMADIDEQALTRRVMQLHMSERDRVLSFPCDVTQLEHVHHLAKESIRVFGRVDWIFNNAGISGRIAPLWMLSPDEIQQVMDVNLYGVLNGIQVFLPILFEQRHRSRIINMASFYGLCSGSNMTAYAMSKHAIVALSESLHFELSVSEKPVDVSVVCPSFANTGLLSNSKPSEESPLHAVMIDLIQRSRDPEEVANHVLAEIEKGVFYILPDREVKDYFEQRMRAIINQTAPHQHNLEKVMQALTRRVVENTH